MGTGLLSHQRAVREWQRRNPEHGQEYYKDPVNRVRSNQLQMKLYRERGRPSSVCKILSEHHATLASDPERLGTEFLLSLVKAHNDRSTGDD
jgi:hypothetical protein